MIFSIANGTVKRLRDLKGFSFISQENVDVVFVHHSAIQPGDFKSLSEGDQVKFEVEQDQSGSKASRVIKL